MSTLNACCKKLFGKIGFSLLFSEPARPLDKKLLSERNWPFERGFGTHVGMFGKSDNERPIQKGVYSSPIIPVTNNTNISYYNNYNEVVQGRSMQGVLHKTQKRTPGIDIWDETETSEILKRFSSKTNSQGESFFVKDETSYTQTPIAMSSLLTPVYGTGHGHKLILIDENKAKMCKICVYCQTNKVRTKSGWYVYTSYRCAECDVPLCHQKTQRDCFDLYHADISKIMGAGSVMSFDEGNT